MGPTASVEAVERRRIFASAGNQISVFGYPSHSLVSKVTNQGTDIAHPFSHIQLTDLYCVTLETEGIIA
jgi:hypothetical protein